MRCNRCGSENCQVINETKTTGSDYSASKGCCGWILFGPLGLLCGLLNSKKTTNQSYWVCNNCGNKWRV